MTNALDIAINFLTQTHFTFISRAQYSNTKSHLILHLTFPLPEAPTQSSQMISYQLIRSSQNDFIVSLDTHINIRISPVPNSHKAITYL